MKFQTMINYAVITLALSSSNASAQDILTGDDRLSCEAILCLSSGTRPSECTPSLNRYFSITDRKPHKMIEKRLNFLKICPAAHEPNMPALVTAIANGAGRCDAQFLNSYNKKTITYKVRERQYEDGNYKWYTVTKEKEVISSQKPNYCGVYEDHEYTHQINTKYIGTEIENGFWSDYDTYDADLQKYNAEQSKSKHQNNLWNR